MPVRVNKMATTKVNLLTAEDLFRLSSEGVRGELIRGVLCETVAVGHEHAKIAATLIIEMGGYVRSRHLGQVAGTNGGILLQRGPDTVREPDVYFISAERLPIDERVQGYLEVVPEIVAEVISPGDSQRDVNDKTRMWLSHGVSLVWEIYPEERAIVVNNADGPPVTLTEDGTLEGGDVLPGFSCPLRDIFEP